MGEGSGDVNKRGRFRDSGNATTNHRQLEVIWNLQIQCPEGSRETIVRRANNDYVSVLEPRTLGRGRTSDVLGFAVTFSQGK